MPKTNPNNKTNPKNKTQQRMGGASENLGVPVSYVMPPPIYGCSPERRSQNRFWFRPMPIPRPAMPTMPTSCLRRAYHAYLMPTLMPTLPTMREGCSAAGLSSSHPATTTIPSSSSSTVSPRDAEKKTSSMIFSLAHPIAYHTATPKHNPAK